MKGCDPAKFDLRGRGRIKKCRYPGIPNLNGNICEKRDDGVYNEKKIIGTL